MAFNNYLFDKNIFEWWFAGQPTGKPILKTVEQWCKDENADFCFNLAEFNMPNTGKYEKLSCCEVVAQGRRISYGYGDFSDMLYINTQNYCHGSSNGIKNGVVKLNRPRSGSRTRNGIGITTTGNLVLSQSGHKATETALCNSINEYVKDRGQTIKLFILEDGGGSTSGYSNCSKLLFNPEGPKGGRPVATVLCVRMKIRPTISHPVYKGCPKDISTELVQMVLGGIAADRDAGNLTKSRIILAQKALGLPIEMCNGTAEYMTLKKLGFNISY